MERTTLGWHGIEGDRRLAFRRIDDRGAFPWLTAGKLPELIRFAPRRSEGGDPREVPAHVRTPEGLELPIFGEELAAEVGRRHGAPVQMMVLKAVVRANDNNAGIYAAVTRVGQLAVGQTVHLHLR